MTNIQHMITECPVCHGARMNKHLISRRDSLAWQEFYHSPTPRFEMRTCKFCKGEGYIARVFDVDTLVKV